MVAFVIETSETPQVGRLELIHVSASVECGSFEQLLALPRMDVAHLSMPCCLSRSRVNANESKFIFLKYHFYHVAPGLKPCNDSPLPTGKRPNATFGSVSSAVSPQPAFPA